MTQRFRFPLSAVLACAIFALAFFYYASREINHDTGWFMYAARGILGGGQLYRDYIDVNAPMAYFTLVPAAWLSGFMSNEAALTFNILGYVLVGYLLCLPVTKAMRLTPLQTLLLRAGILIVMCFMPHYAFGQREHLLAVLMIPYALTAGLRADDRAVPPRIAIACGIAAGFAVSIKLPYVLIPAAIEAAVLLRQRSWKVGVTFDVLALAASTAVIYLISFACYPLYWKDILPSTLALYGPYNNFRFLSDALMLQIPLFMVAFAAGEYRGRGVLVGTRWIMVGATLGAFALFILQQKGWPHHALPLLMLLGVLCVLNGTDLKFKTLRDWGVNWLRGGVILISLLCTFYLAYAGGNVDPGMQSTVENYIHDTDGSYYILSTGNYPAFPLGLNRNYKWTSRYPQLILLPGLVEADIAGKASPSEPAFRAEILEDLKRGHPATVFLYVPTDAGMVDGVDILAWFRRDPDFEKEWSHYRQIGAQDPFAVFRRMPGQ